MTQEQWTWNDAVAKAQERLSNRGLDRLSKPSHEYKDLGAIEHIENLGDEALSNLYTRYMAWHSYATVEFAYTQAAYASIDEIYEVLLGEEMYSISQEQDTRVIKDVLKSLAIQSNEKLKMVFRRRNELAQEVTLLDGMVKGLSIRATAVESESIRRASVRRLEGSR